MVSKSTLHTSRLAISNVGQQSLAVYLRNENNDLLTMLWQFKDTLKLLDSKVFAAQTIGNIFPSGVLSISRISACHVAREVTVVAIQDKNKNLKLLAQAFPEDGQFISQGGTASAEAISNLDICRLGTEMVMTGVRGGDELRLILWRVTKAGKQIVRLADLASDQVFSRLSMCYADQNQLVTALRDGDGNLKVTVWLVTGLSSGDRELDLPRKLSDQALQAKNLEQEIDVDIDACDVENE